MRGTKQHLPDGFTGFIAIDGVESGEKMKVLDEFKEYYYWNDENEPNSTDVDPQLLDKLDTLTSFNLLR